MKRFPLILLMLVLLAGCAHAGTVNLRLGPEGEVLAWLVAGPFPNPHDRDFKACRGFEKDYLRTESAAKPVEGRKELFSARWRLAVGGRENGLDLLPIFRTEKAGVAYLYAVIVSKSDLDGRLLLGSDDGVKVWLNGKLVHINHVTRGVKRDEEQADIRLNRGENRLLLKVDQHFGGWGMMARVVSPAGTTIPGLVERLGIGAKGTGDSPAISLTRSAADKPGILDVDALTRYEQWEARALLWMPWFRENPDTALPLRTALVNWTRKLSAAPNADALSAILRDAALDLEGRFNATWAEFSRSMQDPQAFLKADPKKEDHVRVADGGRYFVHADGRFYTPLGYNHNADWTPLYQCAPGTPAYEPKVTERFFKHLHESGVNLIRMMTEYPGDGNYIEKPVGAFRPEHVAWLDCILTNARKYDIKLMITPYDTFWMSHRWDDSPFNVKNGGPVETKNDFITKRTVIEAQKRRWKYVIDRWGNTGTVFAWELLNESDYWWEASPEQTISWAKEMGDFVRSYEKQKWGRNHLITISTGHPVPGGLWADLAYCMPGMDLASTHLYIGASNAPDEPIGPALAEKEGVTYALSRIKDNRPYIDGENGPINRWIADENLDNEVFHNMSWAHLTSGGAGSGLRWPYRGPHHLTEGMFQHLFRMSKFVKDVPWKKLCASSVEVKVTVPEGWAACGTATKQCALIWVAAPKPAAGTSTISWPDAPDTVRYRCYDTKTGEWFSKGQISGGDLSIAVTEEHGSVAIVLE